MSIRDQLYATYFTYVLSFYHPSSPGRWVLLPHFYSWQIKAQINNLPKGIQLVTGKAWLSDSKVHTLKHYPDCPNESQNSVSSKTLDFIPILKSALANTHPCFSGPS